MKREAQRGKFRDKDTNKNSRGPRPFKEAREARPAREEVASQKNTEELPVREDLIEGRNAVIEALKSDRTIEQILIAKGDVEGSVNLIIGLAKEKKIVIKEVDRKKLDGMSVSKAHQGVIAIVTPYKYFQVDDILNYADEKNEKPFLIILDEIEDPHNFGAIIRSAEVCGAHGIIIPKRRNVGVTPVVYKSSAGAVEHMKIAKVTNLNTVIDELKEKGIWIYGADIAGESYCFEIDFKGALALVIGSEGRGISKLTKNKCDVLAKIPMVGNINSLNASVAGGIMMYEVLKQRFKRD
jgi:23S rRNA (guanosine2251-2'-O)-methyltransferase